MDFLMFIKLFINLCQNLPSSDFPKVDCKKKQLEYPFFRGDLQLLFNLQWILKKSANLKRRDYFFCFRVIQFSSAFIIRASGDSFSQDFNVLFPKNYKKETIFHFVFQKFLDRQLLYQLVLQPHKHNTLHIEVHILQGL